MRLRINGLIAGLSLCLLLPTALAQQKAGEGRRPGREIPRSEGKLKAGDVAPDFTLTTLDGKRKTTLHDFRGKRPVALIFGSYT